MSADLLRRAAAKLREHANATNFGADGWVVDLKDSEVTTTDGGMMIADTMELTGARPDASYIALMHPPVALALADWLDEGSRQVADAVAAWSRDTSYIDEHLGGVEAHAENMFALPFRLAREILREPKDGAA